MVQESGMEGHLKDKADNKGRLEDMAKDGTTIPADSAKPRVIPSVPGPEDGQTPQAGSKEGAQAQAATNPTDIPRGVEDGGATGEVVTGTGNALPGNVENKRLHGEASNAADKGHQRDAKHSSGHTDARRLD